MPAILCLEKPPTHGTGLAVHGKLGLVFDRDVGEHLRLEVADMDAIKFVSRRAKEKHDILITKDGNENLTTAPKGERMLRIIRNNHAALNEERSELGQ